MGRWAEKAQKQIEEDYENGELTYSEYIEAMNDLGAEEEQAAQDAARDVYETYF